MSKTTGLKEVQLVVANLRILRYFCKTFKYKVKITIKFLPSCLIIKFKLSKYIRFMTIYVKGSIFCN